MKTPQTNAHLVAALVLAFAFLMPIAKAADPARISEIRFAPASIHLDERNSSVQILVDGITQDGQVVDSTRTAKIRSLAPDVIKIDSSGTARAIGDGQCTIEVQAASHRVEIAAVVTGMAKARHFNFENDIIPIFNRFGCNGSGCHGKAEGQNGFKLSVFGFDSKADYQALVMEGRGRRVFPAAAGQSLLLAKASGMTPHGGGVRIDRDRAEYRVLHDWIAAGLPMGTDKDPTVTNVKLTPGQRRMAIGQSQQLRVVATMSDGHKIDVTQLAQFQSNNDGLVAVDEHGLVTIGTTPGIAAVMATYLGNVDVFQIVIPRNVPVDSKVKLAEVNFIDRPINKRLQGLNIIPSGRCTDADFLRRAYLDIIGTLPTRQESREFLEDTSPHKRSKLVDDLLKRPEYAAYWGLKWSDLLRVNRRELGHKSAYEYYRWIRDSFAENKPLDQFAAQLIAAEGPLVDSPAGQFFKVVKQPNQMASISSQVFLGVRLECAQCHHHPWDRWSQMDYYGMQAFFTQVSFKKSRRGEMLISSANRKTTHPRSGEEVFAHPLGTENPEVSPEGDRRKLVAQWMTSPDNPWFARNLVNRAWAHFMGCGLVEPVDDFRLTNPPSNPDLLDALAQYFVDNKYDQHALIRAITASAAYQRSPNVNETNAQDEQNFSRYLFKQIDAEVLLDAVSQTTGIGEKFRGVPAGRRAIELWDSEVPHYFLKLFGRPVRVTACECERVTEPTVSQVLHVLNSPQIHNKLSHEAGNIVRLVRQYSGDDYLVEELYLTFFNRLPSEAERKTTQAYLSSAKERRKAAEDIAWTMMNSLEFLFNH